MVSINSAKSYRKIVEFKDFSRLLSDFPVLFKADLILKDFSSKASKVKYVSSLCKPWDPDQDLHSFGPDLDPNS